MKRLIQIKTDKQQEYKTYVKCDSTRGEMTEKEKEKLNQFLKDRQDRYHTIEYVDSTKIKGEFIQL